MSDDVECNINSFASDLRTRADEDYISARICYFHDLHENFLWNAQQCIEKYLKSIALFHRVDVKNQGHDLKSLFKKVDKEIKIGSIALYWPKEENGTIYFNEQFLDFLKRLSDLGLNRYCSNSYSTYGDELIKVDAAVFIIRRYSQPIGAIIGKQGRPLKKEIKKCIDEGKDYTVSGYLGNVLNQEKYEKQRDWFLKGNIFFLKENTPTTLSMKSKSVNHLLARRYQQAKNGNKEQKLVFIETAEYLLDHIYWPSEIKSELEEAIRMTYKQLLSTDNNI
jgi:HEPN domain-containing protein